MDFCRTGRRRRRRLRHATVRPKHRNRIISCKTRQTAQAPGDQLAAPFLVDQHWRGAAGCAIWRFPLRLVPDRRSLVRLAARQNEYARHPWFHRAAYLAAADREDSCR